MQVVRIVDGMPEAVQAAVEVLRRGGVVVLPTETTYGLGCDPRNQAAMGKIYRMKGRDPSKALPLVAGSFGQVRNFFDISATTAKFGERYWPGPLTILLSPADMSLRKAMPVFKDGLAAVRVSSHGFVRDLVLAYGFPLTATSANLSGGKPCLSADEVIEVLGSQSLVHQPDLLIDGGTLEPSEPSTIIKVGADGDVEIVRQGAITL